MRGTRVDYEDCIELAEYRRDEINYERLKNHFLELISYDVAEHRLKPNIDCFLETLREKGICD